MSRGVEHFSHSPHVFSKLIGVFRRWEAQPQRHRPGDNLRRFRHHIWIYQSPAEEENQGKATPNAQEIKKKDKFKQRGDCCCARSPHPSKGLKLKPRVYFAYLNTLYQVYSTQQLLLEQFSRSLNFCVYYLAHWRRCHQSILKWNRFPFKTR